MAASGTNFSAINEGTFEAYEVGGVQIPTNLISVDPATGDVTISGTINVSAGDDADIQFVTGDSAPIDNNGNRHLAGVTLGTLPVDVPEAPADDPLPPTVAIKSMTPASIDTPGQHTFTAYLL